MLLSQCIDTLNTLKLYGMAQSLQTLCDNPGHFNLSLADGLSLLLSQEQASRDNRKQQRLLKAAQLRLPQACIELVDYQHPRHLQKQHFLELAQCQFIQHHRNIIFIGATGLGKTYLACALGQQACRLGITARYYRVPKLLELLRLAHADGSSMALFNQLSKARLLILDDWGLEQLNRQQRHDILEIIEERYQQGATVITTQLPIEHWHDYIGDNTTADAILDRILAHADKIILKGDSLRTKSLTHLDQTTL